MANIDNIRLAGVTIPIYSEEDRQKVDTASEQSQKASEDVSKIDKKVDEAYQLLQTTVAEQNAKIQNITAELGNTTILKNSTVNINQNTPFVGFCTGSSSVLHFSIPLSRPVASDVTSVTVAGASVYVRGATGAYISGAALSSIGSVSAELTGGMIHVSITGATLTGATNNSALSVSGVFTVTFR